MAIGKKMEEAINKQINEELFSAYLYLSMSADFENKNLQGMASWMKVQAKEEKEHAMKLYEHLVERNGTITLDAIKKPQSKWESALAAFEASLKHEKYITSKINSLYELALAEKDYPSQVLLQWFIKEQVEEEANAEDNINKVKMAGNSTSSLMMVDHIFSKRGKKE